MKIVKSERGDTLIEILIAVSILSLTVVASQAIMNHGQSLALRSVERTAAQADANSQFSYLRYFRDEFIKGPDTPGGQAWQVIAGPGGYVQTGSSSAATCNAFTDRPVSESSMFYIDTDATDLTSAINSYPTDPGGPVAASDAPTPGGGMWLLARQSGSSVTVPYIDFYVKACWSSIGSPMMEQLKSVMRLYIP